jgi:6-phosphogluconolactonase
MLLGTGPDGHTASLFPGKPEIETSGPWTVAVPEPGLPPPVPRVSLSFAALDSCRTMLFLATGANKREPLARIGAGERLPAGRVRGRQETVWLLDRAAAGEAA